MTTRSKASRSTTTKTRGCHRGSAMVMGNGDEGVCVYVPDLGRSGERAGKQTMKLTLHQPTDTELTAFLAQATGGFSYPEVGATREGAEVPGYDNDHNHLRLGEGEEVFRAACTALSRWEHFPTHWVKIGPGTPPVQMGQKVAMQARAFGLTWMSAAQVVYTIEEPRRVRRDTRP